MQKINEQVETIIIGGGCIGLCTAYYLIELGYEDFLVLEQGYVGSGSSGRCGSGIRAQFADQTNIKMMKEGVRLWKKLSKELNFDFIQKGYLYLIYNREELKQFEKMKELQNSHGVNTKIISPEEINRINRYLDTTQVLAGCFNPDDGKADPFEVLFRLMNFVNSSGVKILQHTQVTDIGILPDGTKMVQTNRGSIPANKLLNAAGGWAPKIGEMIGLDIPIEPYRHQAIITEPLKERTLDPMIVSLTHHDAYFTQTKDGGIIGGVGIPENEPPTYDTTETFDFKERVSQAFTQIMPPLRFLRILRSWGGYYGITPDGNPMLGKYGLEENYIAAGFSGHGFMMAPIVGKSMAEIIVSGNPKITLDYYDPTRFERGELRETALQIG